MPKISVIVPVYRVEPYLRRCVDSILNQSEQDFELILVDDGSPDSCPAICDDYAIRDSRIHVIHQENAGLSGARNAGIDWVMANSHSTWLAFIDSDDWIHRDYLQLLLAGAEKYGVSVSVCEHAPTKQFQQDLPLEHIEPVLMNSEDAYVDHYLSCSYAHCKLIRRDLMKDLRFPVGKLYEDTYTTYLLVLAESQVAVIPEKLYYYFTGSVSITRSLWNPRRMDELQGHRERLQYLQDHNFPRAYRMELRIMIRAVYDSAETVALSCLHSRQYASYLKPLRKELRQLMKEGKKLYPLKADTLLIYLMAWHTKYLWYPCKVIQVLWWRAKGKIRMNSGAGRK